MSQSSHSAPVEYFHGLILDHYHVWRKKKDSGYSLSFEGGHEFSEFIAECKIALYKKFPQLDKRTAYPMGMKDEAPIVEGAHTAKHTPAPWTIEDKDATEILIFGGPNEKYVASVQVHQTPRSMGQWMEPERVANAELIAKAPETAAQRDQLLLEVERWQRMCDEFIGSGPMADEFEGVPHKPEIFGNYVRNLNQQVEERDRYREALKDCFQVMPVTEIKDGKLVNYERGISMCRRIKALLSGQGDQQH